jgi:hypothetical protein
LGHRGGLRNVANPVGLLINQTAKCFAGEPFQIYRREKAERERNLQELYRDEDGAGKER